MKILSICGSPRKGNSETILNYLQEVCKKEGIDNEIILLRDKNIGQCDGCVEFCNKNLYCQKKDDMPEIIEKMKESDGYIFISPNYFKMPTGLFKDFIDRCSIFFTAKTDLSHKKAAVIVVGADIIPEIDVCLDNIVNNYVKTLGLNLVAAKSFKSNSELNNNFNDILENDLNENIKDNLEEIIKKFK
jgi:multimeric flavodoxin WrbA